MKEEGVISLSSDVSDDKDVDSVPLTAEEKSDRAKNIMRGGQKRAAPDSNVLTSSSSEDSESDGDSSSSSDMIPPTPSKLVVSPTLHGKFTKDGTGTVTSRTGRLPGEKSSSALWTLSGEPPEDKDNVTEPEHCRRKKSDNQSVASGGFFEVDQNSADENSNEDSDSVDEDPEWVSEGEEDDVEDVESLENKLTANGGGASSNAVTEEILDQLKTWLQGIDGGRREEKTAKQYTSQIFTIIQAIDPEHLAVTSLISVKALRDKWLSPLEKRRRPGTCKAYLGSLSKFLRFLMVENPNNLISQGDARKVKEQVLEWMSSYNGPIAERRWEKQLEDLEKLVTPKDIQAFDKSDLARNAISTLGQCMDKSRENLPPTQAEYCLVRDYLLTSICINNACRSGPLSSMTLGELRKAKNEDNQVVVDVLKHKTMKYHGPATVVLSPTIHKWVLAFVTHMRHKQDKDEDRVFLSWSAKCMTSSMITAQINSFWQRATGNGDRVSATSFRKAAVSAVHSDHAHLKKDLADLMSHNPKTAEKFYLIRQKRKNAAKTSESLQNIFRGSASNHEIEDDKRSEEQQTESQESSLNRHVWSTEEEDAIRECFVNNITIKHITIEETRLKIADHPILKNIKATKVRDKVRSLFGIGSDNSSLQLPTEEETAVQKMQIHSGRRHKIFTISLHKEL